MNDRQQGRYCEIYRPRGHCESGHYKDTDGARHRICEYRIDDPGRGVNGMDTLLTWTL